MAEQKGELKKSRRNRKGQLTRTLKLLQAAIAPAGGGVDTEGIQEVLTEAQKQMKLLEEVHESYVSTIEDDKDFEEAEAWMQDCQLKYTAVTRSARNQMKAAGEKTKNTEGTLTKEQKETNAKEQKETTAEESRETTAEETKETTAEEKKETAKTLDELRLCFELPKSEMQHFSGDPGQYWFFIKNFETNIASKLTNPSSKLQYLIQFCTGEARSCVEACTLLGEKGYEQALSILKTQFGQPHLVLNALMIKLTKRKPLNPGDTKGLWRLVGDMTQCHVILTQMGYVSDLNSTTNLLKIQSLLPKYMQAKWVAKAHELLENNEPTFKDMLKFIESQAKVASTMFGRHLESEKKPVVRQSTYNNNTQYNRDEYRNQNKQEDTCPCCNELHKLWNCQLFKGLNVDERWNFCKEKRLCFKCLGDHLAKHCKRKMSCNIEGCTSDHNRLLHQMKSINTHGAVNFNNPGQSPEVENKTSYESFLGASTEQDRNIGLASNANTNNYLVQGTNISLRTIPVVAKKGNKMININVLLDDGSSQSYVNSDVCNELNLSGPTEEIIVGTLNGKTTKFTTENVSFDISPLNSTRNFRVNALVTNNVTGNLKATPWHMLSKDWEHLKDIKFPEVGRSRNHVDMLIGNDNIDLHRVLEERWGKPGEPIARLTPLGWTCVGQTTKAGRFRRDEAFFVHTYHASNNTSDNTDSLIRKFWEMEITGANKPNAYTKEEIMADEIVKNSMVKNAESGRYKVKLPWNENKSQLPPDNFESAIKRLENVERKLQKDESLGKAYKSVIDSYVDKGYVRKVDTNREAPTNQWFLPHFPVVKLNRETTKVRIVYDAAAKYQGISLNDAIYPGPKLLNKLFDVLMRFRRYSVAVVCDISEMYLQIELYDEDKPMLRFLWRDLDSSKEPQVNEYCRVVFGINASPFIALKVSQQNAQRYKDDLPLAAETVLKSTYMDDSLDSVVNEQQGLELYDQLVTLWGQAGMKPMKWVSNSKTFLEAIPIEQRAKSTDIARHDLPSTKALGLTWDAETDKFLFRQTEKYNNVETVTKRIILSKLASIFDPLGFVGPIVIVAKILMQQIWSKGLDWDEPIIGKLKSQIECWLENLHNLDKIEIERCLCPEGNTEPKMHVFCDASNDAYAAVVYLTTTGVNGIKVQFVASKTKVAPVKAISIPRLELLATMLGLNLAMSVTEILQIDLKDVYFWSDSINVLWWIRGRSRNFKAFVANRVGEIQSATNPGQWRHVPTQDNAADIATRGCSVSELSSNRLWWEGPEFLKLPPEQWPDNKIDEMENVEERRAVVFLSRVMLNVDKDWKLNPNRFSKWLRLVRVLAYVLRFITNCRSKMNARALGILNIDEISDAEHALIRQAQHDSFRDELKQLKKGSVNSNSSLSSLFPRVDKDGILRATGRLELNETLPYDVRYPIILPRKHQVTKLIVDKYHSQGNHVAGVNHTLHRLSERFWIISAREEIRECESRCVECKRRTARAGQQVMAPLPVIRSDMGSLRAFEKVAVDFAGPFYTKQGRGKSQLKRYLCLFTCLATRAVHLEIAFSLDTDSFLNAFYRFTSRRGQPNIVLSDNGTNFVSGERELREIVNKLDKDKIKNALTCEKIQWQFHPPLTPHFGGAHERLVRSAKRAMYPILGKADISDEELLSAIVGAEGILNSRPLTYQSASINDVVPLTPNHFLHGQMGCKFASEEILDSKQYDLRKRWRRVQELVKHFWNRWLSEWLPTLNPRKKWRVEKRDFRVNDIVLLKDRFNVRGQWPLGRVLEVFPGPDGHVRVVKIKTENGTFIRNITKVSHVEILD